MRALTLTHAIVVLAGSMIAIVLAMGFIAYAGQQNLVNSQRASCERGVTPRIALINSTFEQAMVDHEVNISTTIATASVRKEKGVQSELEFALVKANAVLLPPSDAKFIPSQYRHLAALSCDQVYPSANFIP